MLITIAISHSQTLKQEVQSVGQYDLFELSIFPDESQQVENPFTDPSVKAWFYQKDTI